MRYLQKGLFADTSILCQFCSCWVHKRCSSIRGTLEENNTFKCQTYANQQTDKAENCPVIELNGQSLEIVGKKVMLVPQEELER